MQSVPTVGAWMSPGLNNYLRWHCRRGRRRRESCAKLPCYSERLDIGTRGTASTE